jgi:hypothetical protein
MKSLYLRVKSINDCSFPFHFFRILMSSAFDKKEGKINSWSPVSQRVIDALFGAHAYAFVQVELAFQGIFFLLVSPVRYQVVDWPWALFFHFYLNPFSEV